VRDIKKERKGKPAWAGHNKEGSIRKTQLERGIRERRGRGNQSVKVGKENHRLGRALKGTAGPAR